MLAFAVGAAIMATFSLRQMNNKDFEKVEEWDFDDVQDAEMVEETPKKKTPKKKAKK